MSRCISISALFPNAETSRKDWHGDTGRLQESIGLHLRKKTTVQSVSSGSISHLTNQPTTRDHLHSIILMLRNDLLLLSDSLQRLVLRVRLVLAHDRDEVFVPAVLLRLVLVVRPGLDVLEDVIAQSVADAAASFALVVAFLVDAAVLVVAGVGQLFVGEGAGGEEEEAEGEELHFC